MQEAAPSFPFRISTTLRGATYYSAGPWQRVVITPERITVHSLFRRHVHRKADLVALRWNESWLGGSVVAISRVEGVPIHSNFGMHRKRRLRAALNSCGYSFTSETQGLRLRLLTKELEEDRVRYGLIKDEGD